jgi:hypothetical protein
MIKDQRPPFLNSQTLKVLVNPAGPTTGTIATDRLSLQKLDLLWPGCRGM